ncbi:MAG: hypothetical protein KDD52_06565 [Bdellovibrionales bacterium]|nr:hypothetical protein [Bdellovibrionales bacterium]
MRTDKQKKKRQETLRYIIQNKSLKKQEELASELSAQGFSATQTTISRDLVEMGVYKASGIYQLPQDQHHPNYFKEEMKKTLHSVMPAGPYMLVLKTDLGGAPKLSVEVEKQAWQGIVGVLAGDDTVFVAFDEKEKQIEVFQKLKASLE